MGQMIWIEVLSPSTKEVLSRHLYEGPRYSIGRGYNNQLVIDDPCVAATHVIVEESEDGVLSVVDQQSLNGMFYEGNKKRQDIINLNDNDTIRIGDTLLRFRTSGFVVPKESRVSRTSSHTGLFVFLFLVLVGLVNAAQWSATTTAIKPYELLLHNFVGLVVMLGWALTWSMVSRTYTGVAAFGRHFKITILLTLSLSLLVIGYRQISFALSSTLAEQYVPYAIIATFGFFIYFHLRRRGAKSNILIGLVILALVGGLGYFSYMQDLYHPTIKTSHDFVKQPTPPMTNILPPTSSQSFWESVKEVKGKIDASRKEDPAQNAPSNSRD